jgi:hypothetical protein
MNMNMKSCSSFSKVNIKLKLKSRIFETYVQVEVEHQGVEGPPVMNGVLSKSPRQTKEVMSEASGAGG